MTMRKLDMARLARFGVLSLLLSVAGPALAAADTAQDFMKDKQGELSAAVKGKADKKVEVLFDSVLDYDQLAKASLRNHWEERTDAERKEFQGILKQLVQRAYRKNLDRTANYDVKFEGEVAENGRFIVKTVAKSRTNAREEPVSIDYVVSRTGDSWRVQDIVTEGSSLVNNYHQQFSRIIKKDGFPELLKRMKSKLGS
jgi:phospholipid transport system substrate-binding protein